MTVDTPWGMSQTCTEVGEGILHVTTASHGGYRVPRAMHRAMKPRYQVAGDDYVDPDYTGGRFVWYEEDCAWSAVCLAYPDLFPSHALEPARATFRDVYEERA